MIGYTIQETVASLNAITAQVLADAGVVEIEFDESFIDPTYPAQQSYWVMRKGYPQAFIYRRYEDAKRELVSKLANNIHALVALKNEITMAIDAVRDLRQTINPEDTGE